jgi:hypothetical protein
MLEEAEMSQIENAGTSSSKREEGNLFERNRKCLCPKKRIKN